MLSLTFFATIVNPGSWLHVVLLVSKFRLAHISGNEEARSKHYHLCTNRLVSLSLCVLYRCHVNLIRVLSATATGPGNTSTPWLAGLDLSVFPGPTLDKQVAQAARYIHANILSPAAVHDDSPVLDPSHRSFVPFTTKVCVFLV